MVGFVGAIAIGTIIILESTTRFTFSVVFRPVYTEMNGLEVALEAFFTLQRGIAARFNYLPVNEPPLSSTSVFVTQKGSIAFFCVAHSPF
jgi:hypothetical protein